MPLGTLFHLLTPFLDWNQNLSHISGFQKSWPFCFTSCDTPLFTNTLRWDLLAKTHQYCPSLLELFYQNLGTHDYYHTHCTQFELLSKQRLSDSDSQLFLKNEIEAIQSSRDITTKSNKNDKFSPQSPK